MQTGSINVPSQLARDKYPANGPHQAVFNNDTRDLFVSNEKDHTVSVFDGNGQVQVVKLPNLPSGTKLQMALSPSERSAVVLADTPQAGSAESDCLFKITPGAA